MTDEGSGTDSLSFTLRITVASCSPLAMPLEDMGDRLGGCGRCLWNFRRKRGLVLNISGPSFAFR